jgi:catechol 2,3-dioxygenase-like lactoylglutathione lyase family enzyme
VTINVRDLERSYQWYRDVLGFELVHRSVQKDGPLAELSGVSNIELEVLVLTRSGFRVELVQYHHDPKSRPIGLHNLGVVVKNADDAYQLAIDAGAICETPPVQMGGSARVFIVDDPDDVRWGCFEFLE